MSMALLSFLGDSLDCTTELTNTRKKRVISIKSEIRSYHSVHNLFDIYFFFLGWWLIVI